MTGNADLGSPTSLRRGLIVRRAEQPDDAAVPRMDVAAIIGFAERGPVNEAIRVRSVAEFTELFGTVPQYLASLPIDRFMWASVRDFFDEGGSSAWIVRLAGARFARVPLQGTGAVAIGAAVQSATPATLIARSPGSWGVRLELHANFEHRKLSRRVIRPEGEADSYGAVRLVSDTPMRLDSGATVLVTTDQGDATYAEVTGSHELRSLTALPAVLATGPVEVDVSEVSIAVDVSQPGRTARAISASLTEVSRMLAHEVAQIPARLDPSQPVLLVPLNSTPPAVSLTTMLELDGLGVRTGDLRAALDAVAELDDVSLVVVPAVGEAAPIAAAHTTAAPPAAPSPAAASTTGFGRCSVVGRPRLAVVRPVPGDLGAASFAGVELHWEGEAGFYFELQRAADAEFDDPDVLASGPFMHWQTDVHPDGRWWFRVRHLTDDRHVGAAEWSNVVSVGLGSTEDVLEPVDVDVATIASLWRDVIDHCAARARRDRLAILAAPRSMRPAATAALLAELRDGISAPLEMNARGLAMAVGPWITDGGVARDPPRPLPA